MAFFTFLTFFDIFDKKKENFLWNSILPSGLAYHFPLLILRSLGNFSKGYVHLGNFENLNPKKLITKTSEVECEK